jgi:PAS domain S-box-containing protein
LLKRRLLVEWIAVLLVALACAAFISRTSFGERMSFAVLDQAVAWRAQSQDNRIIIVEIDETSLSEIGHWPWPRSIHAQLIEAISARKPAGIAYDVLFHEVSNAPEDAALGRAMAISGRVIAPAYLVTPGLNGRAFDLELPINDVRRAAADIGHVNVVFDSDGVVRRAQMQFGDHGELSIAHMMKVLSNFVRLGSEPRSTSTAREIIPYLPLGSFPTIRAKDVMAGEVPAALLRDKIVLVGATAQGLGDFLAVPSPAGSAMPGVEVQANLLNALLAKKPISEPSALWSGLAAAVSVLFAMTLFWRLQPTRAIFAAVFLAIAAFFLSILLLNFANIWIAPTAALIALFLAYPMWSWRRLAALNAFVISETRTLRLSLGSRDSGSYEQGGLDAIAQATEQLRSVVGKVSTARSFMQSIIDNAPDALSVLDSSGRILLTNDAAKTVFGHEARGQTPAELLENFAKSETDGADEIQLADGRIMLIKSVAFSTSEEDEAGSILRLADVTDRRLAEQERDEMLEFLSHDMRAPQAAILALLDLHEAKADGTLPTNRIRESARLSLKLADDFVQLAKLSKSEPAPEEMNLESVLIEAVDRNYSAAQFKSIVLEQRFEDDGGYILADPWILSRAFNNLIDNAIKYGPASSIVTIVIRRDGETLLASVSDRGPGIPPERKGALFERFGPNDKRTNLSAGLGLAYVKKAADLFGAALECESSSSGTTFTMTFSRLPDYE